MSFDMIIRTMQYLGYVTHLADGSLNPLAAAVARSLEGKIWENINTSPRIAEEWKKFSACEFCGAEATKIEEFDRPVPVCDQCHAE